MCEMRTARLHRPKWGSVLFVHARTHAASRGTRARTCTAHAGCLSTAAFLVAPLHRQGTGGSARDASCPTAPPVRQRRLRCGSGCASGQAELAMARERESRCASALVRPCARALVRSCARECASGASREWRECASARVRGLGGWLPRAGSMQEPSTRGTAAPAAHFGGLSGLDVSARGRL